MAPRFLWDLSLRIFQPACGHFLSMAEHFAPAHKWHFHTSQALCPFPFQALCLFPFQALCGTSEAGSCCPGRLRLAVLAFPCAGISHPVVHSHMHLSHTLLPASPMPFRACLRMHLLAHVIINQGTTHLLRAKPACLPACLPACARSLLATRIESRLGRDPR